MSPRISPYFALAVTALIMSSHLSCGGKTKPPAEQTGTVVAQPGQVLVQDDTIPDGLAFRLSEGSQRLAGGARVKPAKATVLPAAEAARLLGRMKPIKNDPDDRKNFALREKSQPPPRTGDTIKTPFPPPVSLAPPTGVDPAKQTLEVLRFAPEGEVPLVPQLSVTFSQPMIAVTSHADTVAKGLPVKLTPQPKGQWRWVGTRTLLFDPEIRFPQATTYQVEIPAGVRSATGQPLKEAKRWSFTTPAPRVISSFPNSGPQPRDPVIFIAFDQRIDPAAVLATISIEAGGKPVPVRAATDAEIAAHAEVKELVAVAEKDELAGRYLTLVADTLLPVDTRIVVNVGPGTPSTEGPLKTKARQSFNFKTYGPLKVVEARCSWGSDCPPMTPWYIQFSNPLDEDAYDDRLFALDPAVPGFKTELHENYVYTRGRTKGRTTYTLTLPASLKDRFGQTLGQEEELTFRVGSADPRLWGPQGLVVSDPAAKQPTLDVFSINWDQLKVQIYQVAPSDWPAYVAYMRDFGRYGKKPTPPGKRVVDTVIKVKAPRDEMAETAIDLSPAMTSGLGHAVVVVEPTPWKQKWNPPTLNAWVQSTKIGLDGFVDDTELYAWATRLADGAPLPGARLEIAPFGLRGTTDAQGTAHIALANKKTKAPNYLVATVGKDSALLPENIYYWSDWGGWSRRDVGDTLRWFVFDDRQMYRPGETVSVKGWIRRFQNREGGDLAGLQAAVDQIAYTLYGPRGNKLTTGKIEVDALGGFDTKIELPKTPNLGWARIELVAGGKAKVDNRTYHHRFQIQEFRRPEFEVTAKASPGPHEVGEAADVTVSASYYAGGGLPNADVNWQVTSQPGSFTPPNRGDYIFGTFVPWWDYYYDGPNTRSETKYFTGKTDAVGKHTLHIDFLSVKPPRPMQVTAQAQVIDVNRQRWAATATLLVHPADLYVGLKSAQIFVEQNQPIEIDALVVDQDGTAVTGKLVDMTAVRMEWKYEKGKYTTEEVDPQSCQPTSTADPVKCTFPTKEGGRYKILATVVDDKGRRNQTELSIWVSGGESPPARNVEQERVTLIPDKKSYQPGEVARILVQAPFYPAEAILSLRRSGIVKAERFTMTGPTKTLEVPIVDGYTPNLYVQVDLVGAAARVDDKGKPATALPKRPAFAVGTLNLSIPPLRRTLKVDVVPRARKLEPGGKTTLDIKVADAAGQPVAGAELAVVVVDEAVLSLSNYQTPDIVAAFYGERGPGGRDHHSRAYVALARPDEDLLGGAEGDTTATGAMADDDDGVMMKEEAATPPAEPSAAPPPAPPTTKALSRNGPGGGGSAPAPIAVRSNFDALAVFAPAVDTDRAGHATVPVTVPDNLTRYRVMVLAVHADKQFGGGESSITARMPLMVRPSPPRFLNFGDRFELPVVLQNQTDAAFEVEVAVRTSNATMLEGAGRRLSVPANDRLEVRFPIAAELPGTARFQIAATAGKWADAAELALPVWTPATTEAFATYGEIDKGVIRQPVAMPGAVVKEFGGLEITTSSTQLQALTDAFLYLVAYPFECAEQLSSRILAVAALRDVLTAFQAQGLPPVAEIEAAVKRDIERLQGLQNYDGGFAFWQRGYESWPFVSIHVAHALTRAKDKGYAVPDEMLRRSQAYLRDIENHIPGIYPPEVRRTLIAYALYVRKRMGDLDTARARQLLAEDGGIKARSMEAVGWILGVLTGDKGSKKELEQIRRHLANNTTETAAAANFVTSYSDGGYLLLHSDRRVDGIILDALIEDQPKSDLIPKLVRGLLGHRTRGRWENTQENAFVLLALDHYFNVYEKTTPDFVARAWLGTEFAGEHKFKGRTTDRKQIDIPMSYLAKVGAADLTLQKQGKGRLYYRIGMTYAPADLKLDPADHGFAIERVYQPIDDPGDVKRMANGSWQIKAGARVRVRLTMVAESRRYHVALVDPLPAGLEPMNPALAVTGALPADPDQQSRGRYWWWYRTWYEHQNLRDERVEAFTSLLWEGVHNYSYVAIASTPGQFVVPPTKAEEMYHPETFGRSASDRVIVK